MFDGLAARSAHPGTRKQACPDISPLSSWGHHIRELLGPGFLHFEAYVLTFKSILEVPHTLSAALLLDKGLIEPCPGQFQRLAGMQAVAVGD